MTAENKDADKPVEEKTGEKPAAALTHEQQWQLARGYLRRSEEIANRLRTMLFALSAIMALYLVTRVSGDLPRLILGGRIIAIVLCGASMFILVRSWLAQSANAQERFQYLRDGNFEAYRLYDSALENIAGNRNSRYDKWAFMLVVAALLIELALRISVSTKAISAIHV